MKILIVRPTALGDVCRTVPALVSLRRALPDARIDWLVHEGFADAVRHHPDLDGVVTFPRRELGRLYRSLRGARMAWRWLNDLRGRRYDVAIDLQGLLRSGLITRLCGAADRVGFANARECAWLGYNRRFPVDDNLHTVDRMLGLIEAMGYAPHRDMQLYVGPDDLKWFDHWKAEIAGPTASYACLAPTARWRCKCWPIERYVALGRRMLDHGLAGQRLVVLAAPHEEEQVRPLREAFDSVGDTVLFPRTTVGQMMALLSRSRLLVCNDSAPLHIAVGFARPVVAIYGPTNPTLVGPYRRDDAVIRPAAVAQDRRTNYRAHRDDQSLIAQVELDEVWSKIGEQMEGVGGEACGGKNGA